MTHERIFNWKQTSQVHRDCSIQLHKDCCIQVHGDWYIQVNKDLCFKFIEIAAIQFIEIVAFCGQSYNHFTIVNYDSSVVIWGIFK